MKIQLDTKLKIIKVEESVGLGELIDSLEKLLPKGLWKEFKLETSTVINWGSPIIINDRPWRTYPWYTNDYNITCCNTTDISSKNLCQGIYNVQI